MTEENKYIIDDEELFGDANAAAEEAVDASEGCDTVDTECAAECDKKANAADDGDRNPRRIGQP